MDKTLCPFDLVFNLTFNILLIFDLKKKKKTFDENFMFFFLYSWYMISDDKNFYISLQLELSIVQDFRYDNAAYV